MSQENSELSIGYQAEKVKDFPVTGSWDTESQLLYLRSSCILFSTAVHLLVLSCALLSQFIISQHLFFGDRVLQSLLAKGRPDLAAMACACVSVIVTSVI